MLVGAHYCSWFDGSTDNVTGDCCVLELARILKQFDGKLRYGIRFAWWPGHSHGRYSGSTWYADTFWHELRDHAIAYFNIDSPGVKGATVYVPRHQMAEVADFNETMTTEVTGWTTMKSSNAQLAIGKRGDKYVSPTRPARAADQSFWGIGVSSMSVYSMLTPDDPTATTMSAARAAPGGGIPSTRRSTSSTRRSWRRTRISMRRSCCGSATAEILPYNLSAIAQDYLDSLKEYDEEAGQWLPIKELMDEVLTLQAKLAGLQARCSDLNAEARTAAANRAYLRIARILNPVLYQTCSPFAHDPALGSRSLPGLAPALKLKAMNPDGDTFKFAVVGLKRRLNQVRHAVREAAREVDLFSRDLN